MSHSKTLQGFKTLITRPLEQANTLKQKIEALGGDGFILPLLEITSPQDIATAIYGLSQLERYPIIIFTSKHAVDYAFRYWPADSLKDVLNAQTILAIGQSTAKQLMDRGIKVTAIPENEMTSEGLLDLPLLQTVSAQSIAILSGEGGRNHLIETLAARGAKATKIAVYRRKLPDIDLTPYIHHWQKNGLDVIVITSGESVNNLLTLVPVEYHDWLKQQLLLVVSERLMIVTKSLGFIQTPVLAKSASDDEIIAALCSIRSVTI